MSLLASNATAALRSIVAASTSSVSLLLANRDRKGWACYNNGTGILYIAFGATPGSTTDYSVAVNSGSFYESSVDYTGPVSGAWSATGGTGASLTEFS